MKKIGSNTQKETPEQVLARLCKENSKLKTQKEADKTKIKDLRKELKKDVPTITISKEQRKLLSSLFPDIDSVFSYSADNALCGDICAYWLRVTDFNIHHRDI